MNIRQIALRILDEYEVGGKFINLALSTHLTDGLSREEKAALTVLIYTSVERKLTYDYYICALSKRSESDIEPHTKNILRLGLCQILDMHSVPDFAAVNESVKLAKTPGEKSFVNGVLRAAVRQKDNMPMPPKEKNYRRYLSVKYSFPLATVKHFVSLFGEEKTERMLDFFNNVKYTDISVNSLKSSREDYCERLSEAGYHTKIQQDSPLSIRILDSVNPEMLPGFRDGFFLVQDTASAIASSLLDPKEGDLVVDVCAAPGGKSFAASILSGGKAEIHSYDLHESKLSLIKSGAQRLGFENITVEQRDATTPDSALVGKADRVICDAPCSGLGVLGKKPDLRYKDISDLSALTELQLEILTASSRYLKKGGYLVYSTCTLNPLENESVVERFLSENPEYELVPFVCCGNMTDGMHTMLPFEHLTDGFFMAKIRRK